MNKSQKRRHTARVRRDQEDRRLSKRPIRGPLPKSIRRQLDELGIQAAGELDDDKGWWIMALVGAVCGLALAGVIYILL